MSAFNARMSVSTHSRPKAAGFAEDEVYVEFAVSTHSRPKAAGLNNAAKFERGDRFQHTAARRRLDGYPVFKNHQFIVSTHSRPKAAGQWVWFF